MASNHTILPPRTTSSSSPPTIARPGEQYPLSVERRRRLGHVDAQPQRGRIRLPGAISASTSACRSSTRRVFVDDDGARATTQITGLETAYRFWSGCWRSVEIPSIARLGNSGASLAMPGSRTRLPRIVSVANPDATVGLNYVCLPVLWCALRVGMCTPWALESGAGRDVDRLVIRPAAMDAHGRSTRRRMHPYDQRVRAIRRRREFDLPELLRAGPCRRRPPRVPVHAYFWITHPPATPM